MVNQDIIKRFYKVLGSNLYVLLVGGSVARGNFISGWSDIDILVALEKVDIQVIKKIAVIEKQLTRKLKLKVDSYIVTKQDIKKLNKYSHSKLKNFYFYLSEEMVLVGKPNKNLINYKEYVYGLETLYFEQRKSMWERALRMDITSRLELELELKKNIKVIFLIVKRLVVSDKNRVNTYDKIIESLKTPKLLVLKETLIRFNNLRESNQITALSIKQLKAEYNQSLLTYSRILYIINNNSHERN